KMNFPVENLAKISKLFMQTLSQTVSSGFKQEELTKIKNQYISSKVYERESLESYAFGLGHGFAQSGNIYCEDAFIEQIRRTTLEAVWDGSIEIIKQFSQFTIQVPKGNSLLPLERELKKWQTSLRKTGEKLKVRAETTKYLGSEFDPAVQVIQLKPG